LSRDRRRCQEFLHRRTRCGVHRRNPPDEAGATGKSPYARHLREALEHLLRERPCNVAEWGALTGAAFWDDARLYAYLQDLHGYFYEGRKTPPQAPDPEGAMPDRAQQV
jgi:hypothetical protein